MQLHKSSSRFASLWLLIASISMAGVVDRVAVVIGKQVVTESEVLDDLRLTEFINNEPLILSAPARQTAADHLVDQELIRRELELSGYAKPLAAEADALLRKLRQGRFHSLADYRAALHVFGITEDELKRRLLWQRTAVQFIDFRFGTQPPEPDGQSAGRAGSDAPVTSADQQMEAWLKQARRDTKITLRPEAFQ